MSAMKSAEEAEYVIHSRCSLHANQSSEEFIANMFQVNLFGHMRVTQAITPLFRDQGHGIIAFTSSSTAWTPLPFMSHYAASKAALSAYVEGLHRELRPQGIQCVAFECGGFPTHLGQPRNEGETGFGSGGPSVAAYAQLFAELVGKFSANPMAHMPGDLGEASSRIVDVVKREGIVGGRPWAVRVALGSDGMGSARQKCREMLQLLDAWEDVSVSTDREGQAIVANEEMFGFTSILEV
jgi:short-subunit dehydrogenase